MQTEGVTLNFTDDAIDAIAEIAVHVNATVENIGARRLQTVLERILDDISFSAPDRSGEEITVDGAAVRAALGAASRTASTTRSSSRARFSSEPPYSSVRVFDSGERNWCSR